MAATSTIENLVAVSVAPMHLGPSRASEQASQALLGESVALVDSRGAWRRIRTPDDYEGWVVAGSIAPRPMRWEAPWARIGRPWVNLRHGPVSRSAARHTGYMTTTLPRLRERDGWVELGLPRGGSAWVEPSRVIPADDGPDESPTAVDVVRTAEWFLGCPYLWGGRTALGIDCSGLVQVVWRHLGVQLPRDAREQVLVGLPIGLDEVATGDLIFFGATAERDSPVTHVGIAIDRSRMIHAKGSDYVRVDRWTDPPYGDRHITARRVIAG